ncbi:MAG TPA: N,N-dimethylformamidase beta subunit family domain-containing protein [Streptosporangiaceae bacterium]|jgi:hypothetical protein|nr:N,N-dimethylformamidase beta subunit family domain-containing protein [Streptosporangiaceae bacterium]
MSEATAGPAAGPPYAWSPRGWPSERPSADPAASEVWCYTDRLSYAPGDRVDFHLSATAASFTLEITRDGAAPETVFRRDGLSVPSYPVPADAYAAGCGWPAGFSLDLPRDWRSGFYVVTVRAVSPAGEVWEREHGFTLRAAPDRRGDIALILTTSTMLAYNDWGGANHYRGIGDDPRADIGSPVSSTQRPIARGMIAKPPGTPREANPATPPMFAGPRYPAYEWARLHGYSRHHADAFWATYERPFAAWAESNGYELDYLTQHDLHFDPAALSGYRCAIVVGHDEYWSGPMRDVVDAFVDAGGGLARFGGNFAWQVRLSEDGTEQYCYRLPSLDPITAQAPHLATTFWEVRSLGRPGAATVGLNALGGIYNRYGMASPRSSGGFTIYRPEHWALAGTDLYYGDTLGATPVCLAGFELDAVEYTFRRGLPFPTFEDGAPESLEILAMAPAQRGEEDRWNGQRPLGGPVKELQESFDVLGDDLPAYVAEGENRGAGMIAAFSRGEGEVFNGGSTEWPYALSVRDPFVEQIVRNVLDRFTRDR